MDVVKLMTCSVMCGCCEVDDLFCDVEVDDLFCDVFCDVCCEVDDLFCDVWML